MVVIHFNLLNKLGIHKAMLVEISEKINRKFYEKWDIHLISKQFPQIHMNYKGEIVNLECTG